MPRLVNRPNNDVNRAEDIQPTLLIEPIHQEPIRVSDWLTELSNNPPSDLWGATAANRVTQLEGRLDTAGGSGGSGELWYEPASLVEPISILEDVPVRGTTIIEEGAPLPNIHVNEVTEIPRPSRDLTISFTAEEIARSMQDMSYSLDRSTREDCPANVDRRCIVRPDRKHGIESVKTE